jgi:sulfite reductase (NADPH) flavoprotein alpha-component
MSLILDINSSLGADMIRKLHRWPGLVAALFLIVLALSGAMLSVFPALDAVTAPSAQENQTVADLATLARAAHPGLEQIRRAPSGQITVWWFDENTPGSAVFDPITGTDMGSADPNQMEQWLINFHRSLFLDDTGRIAMAIAAAMMLILSISGALLVSHRVGGLRHWFDRQQGPFAARFHTQIARIAVPVLILSAFTALWMTGSTFDLLPDDAANPAFPRTLSATAPMALDQIPSLIATPVQDLRDLTFPADTSDVFTLTTGAGMSYIDQGTGAVLAFDAPGLWTRIYEWIYLLHTGQGAALWGLILGLSVLSVPVLAVTGAISWAKGRRAPLRGMAKAAQAETVVLVGSEGGTTWGFATTFARAMQAAGQSVHLAPLSSFAPQSYGAARQIVVMTATWGQGTAPTSAKGALDRLAAATPSVPMAVLGFGDDSFADFCAYAADFDRLAREKGWQILMPMDRINRQSAPDFNRWGRAFGASIGIALELNHQAKAPRSLPLTLISRRDYGEAVQAPAAILRFAIPKISRWDKMMGRGFGRFQAGDLLGILPQGDRMARFYSLASGSKDGFVEIAIRKHPNGLCSGQLMALAVGDRVNGFLRPNPAFHLDHTKMPMILIGAGTGIGPLAGFIRAQGMRRPIHLWYGARHPEADFYYGAELSDWRNDDSLRGLHMAFSRHGPKIYVQDALRQDADGLRQLMASEAKIMVCGGRDMALGVRDALSDVLAPLGLTAAQLKLQGRYFEDVY